MFIYTLKRLLLALAVALVVSALSFGLLYLSGDPATAIGGEAATDTDIEFIRKTYGFDQPVTVQYLTWMGKAFEEAMAEARAGRGTAEEKPLVLADFTDNPGSGGYGDGIRLLRAMIEADLPNAAFACVPHPQAVQKCIAAGVGSGVTMDLGARIDPRSYGPPLRVSGIVEHVSDGVFTCQGPMNKGVRFSMGPTAVFRHGGVRVLITTNNLQVYDLQVFLSQKIDPQTCEVVAVKSWHHFRAAFEPIARKVMLVDSGGLVSMDLKRFNYRKVRRPIYPLDLD